MKNEAVLKANSADAVVAVFADVHACPGALAIGV
jgi:hypothetical protein